MQHLMIDIETLSRKPTAVITSIGAKFFSLADTETGPEFFQNIDIESAQELGLSLDADTIQWWFTQSEEAQKAFLTDPQPIKDVLVSFWSFIRRHRRSRLRVWSHATFDVPILCYAFKQADIEIPWHYRETRDLRTLNDLTRNRPKNEVIRAGTHHNALDDVKHQIRYAVPMLQYIEELEQNTRGIKS